MRDTEKDEQSSQDARQSRIGSSEMLYQIQFWNYANKRWVNTRQDPEDLDDAKYMCEHYRMGTKQRIVEKEVITRRFINV